MRGITANRDRLAELFDRSLATVTALVPFVGYTKATEVASEALRLRASWKLTAMFLVAIPVVALGFVLPEPLYRLVHSAAQMIGGAS